MIATSIVLGQALVWVAAGIDGAAPATRVWVPRVGVPLLTHPGNVFLLGEAVSVPLPREGRERIRAWRALDDRLEIVAQGEAPEVTKVSDSRQGRLTVYRDLDIPYSLLSEDAELGALTVGWYRIEFLDVDGALVNATTAAVLAPLAEPVSEDSPVCIDGALSWHENKDPCIRQNLASLAALAGANWIRDRLRWRELEPEEGRFAEMTPYDSAAAVEAGFGLRILDVFHGTPAWAAEDGENTGRFPPDLRVAYRFCKAMAERFKGRVQAWEPWNEGNAHNFGGHTIDEMCAYQKAAFLGFRAGDPQLLVGWNPMGGINTATLAQGVLENETWPYYDTYNIHSYDWPHDYERLWEPARAAAAGRPIWVTECDRGMPAEPGDPQGDFSHEFALRKAEFMAQSYASSLGAGASRHFHFILGHYMEQENTIQFGLLRRDLTPRPSYVALAALGRFLADARCLGRCILPDQPDASVYAFRGRPDGRPRDVLVAWTERPVDWAERGKTRVAWRLPESVPVEEIFDYLGRSIGIEVPGLLGSAPLFVVLGENGADGLDMTPPPSSPRRDGEPSPVVLQVLLPDAERVMDKPDWTEAHWRALPVGEKTSCEIAVYNFSDTEVRGTIAIESCPQNVEIEPTRWEAALEPMGRQILEGRLRLAGTTTPATTPWIKLRGEFGPAGRPVAAFKAITRSES